jgi:hypothetical protein
MDRDGVVRGLSESSHPSFRLSLGGGQCKARAMLRSIRFATLRYVSARSGEWLDGELAGSNDPRMYPIATDLD